jgi:2'-5' RNA ligase
MKKRLFLAIQLPPDMRQDLGKYKRMVKVHDAHWTAEENLHVTTYFLGDIDEQVIENLTADLAAAVATVLPFTIVPRYITFAPPHDPRRMIWLQFHGNQAFTNLVSMCYHAITVYLHGQQAYDEARVTPHVTLARLSRPPTPGIELPRVGLPEVPVTSVDLVESVLMHQGPLYTVLETFTLRGV